MCVPSCLRYLFKDVTLGSICWRGFFFCKSWVKLWQVEGLLEDELPQAPKISLMMSGYVILDVLKWRDRGRLVPETACEYRSTCKCVMWGQPLEVVERLLLPAHWAPYAEKPTHRCVQATWLPFTWIPPPPFQKWYIAGDEALSSNCPAVPQSPPSIPIQPPLITFHLFKLMWDHSIYLSDPI